MLLPRDYPLLVRPGPSNHPPATAPNWPMLALRVDTRQLCHPLVPAPQSWSCRAAALLVAQAVHPAEMSDKLTSEAYAFLHDAHWRGQMSVAPVTF